MLSNITYYSCPDKIVDAVKELKRGKGKYTVFAGGTSIVLNKMPQITGLVSLKKVKLDYIIKNKNILKIGAMTRIQDILENNITKKFACGLLYKACYRIGSTLNRNLITLGGNIVQIFKWSDLPVALLVLDVKVKIKGMEPRVLKFTDFLKKYPKTILKYTDIVTEIEIKEPPGKFGTEFLTFSKTEFDYALCDIAVLIKKEGRKCKDIRIGYGGIKPLPFRGYQIEMLMKNKVITEELINRVSEEFAAMINPSADFRVSKEYKKNLIKVLTKQAIKGAL